MGGRGSRTQSVNQLHLSSHGHDRGDRGDRGDRSDRDRGDRGGNPMSPAAIMSANLAAAMGAGGDYDDGPSGRHGHDDYRGSKSANKTTLLVRTRLVIASRV
jgi:hypothetical protein